MQTPKKPNLACDAPEFINFPVIASPKLDGIRATVWNCTPLTRTLKDVPNKYIRETIKGAILPAIFDGELIVGDATSKDCYRNTVSGVMSADGVPEFALYVFDYVGEGPFSGRWGRLVNWTAAIREQHHWFKVLEQVYIQNQRDLDAFEAKQLALGFEGIITRNPNGLYKHGRSTPKDQGILKVKRFTDDEAEVIGFEELMHNGNEPTINAMGHTQRSTHKANKVPRGVLGALVCRGSDGVQFNIGTGFTMAERTMFWAGRTALPGRIAKFKKFKVGEKDAPRHPVFLGWRSPLDV